MGQQQSFEQTVQPRSYREPPHNLYAQPPSIPTEPSAHSDAPMTQQSEPAAVWSPPAAASISATPPQAQPPAEQPLWRWLLQDVGQRTVGVARVDLVRPRAPPVEEGGSIWASSASDGVVGYPSVGHGSTYSRMQNPEFRTGVSTFGGGQRERGGLLGYGAARGARLKIMRSIEIGKPAAAARTQGQKQNDSSSAAGRVMEALQKQPPVAGPWGLQPAMFSFGVGANFELDTNELSLQTRLKFQDWFTLKLQKSIQLGNTPVSLRVRYEVPLEALDDPLRPPARLLIKLENHVGSGVRLGTTGVEFDPRLISLGSSAGVRFAGAAHFPRQIPVPEGEKLLDWQVDRLGLKTRW